MINQPGVGVDFCYLAFTVWLVHVVKMTLARWHQRQINRIQRKAGLSDYQILWITFAKGIIIGFLLAWIVVH